MNKATLSSPDGEFKTVVDVGSNQASVLQGQGWVIYDESKNKVDGIQAVDVNEAMTAFSTAQEEIQTEEKSVDPGRPDSELTNKEAFDKGGITQANGYTDTEYANLVKDVKARNGLTEAGSMLIDSMEFEDFGNKQYTTRELETLIQNSIADAEGSLTPYYNELQDKEVADLKSGFEKIRTDASAYKANEAMDYKSALASTQKSLADRGLTFSGIARQELGANSALGAGSSGKGRLNEARDLAYESNMEGFKTRNQALGRAGEKYFGTDKIKGLDTSIPDRESTYGGYKSISNIATNKSNFEQDKTKNIFGRASTNLQKKPTTSTPTNWETAYSGRFSHLKNNPNRARQLADEYDKTEKTSGGWRGTK